MVDYVFPQDYITQKGSHGKYPVKTCCVSDDLSGDMLAPSWPNLVLSGFPDHKNLKSMLFSSFINVSLGLGKVNGKWFNPDIIKVFITVTFPSGVRYQYIQRCLQRFHCAI